MAETWPKDSAYIPDRRNDFVTYNYLFICLLPTHFIVLVSRLKTAALIIKIFCQPALLTNSLCRFLNPNYFFQFELF